MSPIAVRWKGTRLFDASRQQRVAQHFHNVIYDGDVTARWAVHLPLTQDHGDKRKRSKWQRDRCLLDFKSRC